MDVAPGRFPPRPYTPPPRPFEAPAPSSSAPRPGHIEQPVPTPDGDGPPAELLPLTGLVLLVLAALRGARRAPVVGVTLPGRLMGRGGR